MKPCDHDSFPLYKKLIVPLRDKAQELGYALAVHGTLKRDIDLIACPWVPEAADARTLAEAILEVSAAHNNGLAFLNPREDDGYFWAGCPGSKSHGRLTWSFYLGSSSYIDLSVMPRAGDCLYETGQEIMDARMQAEVRGPMFGFVGGQRVGNGNKEEG